jgi:hypothetical protein
MIRQKSMKKGLKMKNSVYKDQKYNNQLFKSHESQSKILKTISDYPLTQEKT